MAGNQCGCPRELDWYLPARADARKACTHSALRLGRWFRRLVALSCLVGRRSITKTNSGQSRRRRGWDHNFVDGLCVLPSTWLTIPFAGAGRGIRCSSIRMMEGAGEWVPLAIDQCTKLTPPIRLLEAGCSFEPVVHSRHHFSNGHRKDLPMPQTEPKPCELTWNPLNNPAQLSSIAESRDVLSC